MSTSDSAPSGFSTGFLLHPAAALHDTGWGHPEHQGRMRALASAVSRDMMALHDRVAQVEPRTASDEELLRVHTREHLEGVRKLVDEALEKDHPVALDPDTVVSGPSWDAAAGSTGAVLAAVDGVHRGAMRNAFVATRPPGHHATPSRGMGFCLLNHVAVATRYVLDRGMAERVLIVDWDVHHGNGTQEAFYEEGGVYYLSLHQHPHFPGTGRTEDRGAGPGEGTVLNVPLAPGTSREEYRDRFQEAMARARGDFHPDFVFISCGFDVLAGDPLGGQLVEPEDLHRMTREVMCLADEEAGGRVVVVLEGGYVLDRLGAGTVCVLRALAGLDPPGQD
jgi:acetoin utilization deacetylase AcuC-like enzyme